MAMTQKNRERLSEVMRALAEARRCSKCRRKAASVMRHGEVECLYCDFTTRAALGASDGE
jgi:bacterioferritin-associated ferredoxin